MCVSFLFKSSRFKQFLIAQRTSTTIHQSRGRKEEEKLTFSLNKKKKKITCFCLVCVCVCALRNIENCNKSYKGEEEEDQTNILYADAKGKRAENSIDKKLRVLFPSCMYISTGRNDSIARFPE